jgi:hypothetical protein
MFKEYTILCLVGLLIVFFIDNNVTKQKLYKTKLFYIFFAFVFVLQTIVDNYLNGRFGFGSYIVGPYNLDFYSGIKIWSTPLENYLFGIDMLYLNLTLYEYFKARNGNSFVNN